ncbi:hypothetical protein ACFP1I_12895 [Dyadobacter subterraneus]|uniref:Uncharacterized protein n=1 Tax=Dyadobacter subterraneus TaxID=2773304 RepID=A0ABR9W9F9_9BACT|nr:hypothetical protein [Dyadobacter subterraneus]MBE9462128.1 hypothetical protein [Dyadobacter subterraneus]
MKQDVRLKLERKIICRFKGAIWQGQVRPVDTSAITTSGLVCTFTAIR